jgi:hypothetical protein
VGSRGSGGRVEGVAMLVGIWEEAGREVQGPTRRQWESTNRHALQGHLLYCCPQGHHPPSTRHHQQAQSSCSLHRRQIRFPQWRPQSQRLRSPSRRRLPSLQQTPPTPQVPLRPSQSSPLVWRKELDAWLHSVGFTPTLSDDCIYRRVRNGALILIALHVDDQIIASSDLAELQSDKKEIDEKYGITDNGELCDFLGMRITRDRPARKLWIENLLESFGLSDCNPVKTALPPKFKFRPSTPEDHLLAKDFPFAQVVGSLLLLAFTSRSDIAHAASLLSRALSNWNREHWQAAKGCLRYLRGTFDLALTYDASGDDSILEAYCDADWAGCEDTYRSTTGYIVKTCGGTVSWKSVRQASHGCQIHHRS